jgi:hypothetical protein
MQAQMSQLGKELYETIHPETKQGAAPGKAGGGKKKRSEESHGETLGESAEAFIAPRDETGW